MPTLAASTLHGGPRKQNIGVTRPTKPKPRFMKQWLLSIVPLPRSLPRSTSLRKKSGLGDDYTYNLEIPLREMAARIACDILASVRKGNWTTEIITAKCGRVWREDVNKQSCRI